ncbi:MAG: site-specific integrase [Anaerolineae bacterium]|nr:site-specific integrase [Anaerolineae bacterium]
MDALIPKNQDELLADEVFQELVRLGLRTLESADSGRVYQQTYKLWQAYCQQNGLSPLEMTPARVIDFLESQNTTKATRQRQLSAMRKLAQMAYVLTPDDSTRRLYEALKIIKAPAPSEDTSAQERTRRALTPAQADQMLRVWDSDKAMVVRNRALVAVLLLGGIRRSEAAALRWDDVDFENGVVHIRHGKGDKSRDVPLAGEYALNALRAWQRIQPDGYQSVFTPVNRGDHVGKDKAISGTDVYRIWAATAEAAQIESKPHDARRTFITEALATGTPISTVQSIAGHARGETTLRYAQSVDARRARKELKLRYG